MGIMNAIDVFLVGASKVLLFFRGFWDMLPVAVQALILVTTGLFILFGLIRMIF